MYGCVYGWLMFFGFAGFSVVALVYHLFPPCVRINVKEAHKIFDPSTNGSVNKSQFSSLLFYFTIFMRYFGSLFRLPSLWFLRRRLLLLFEVLALFGVLLHKSHSFNAQKFGKTFVMHTTYISMFYECLF